MRRFKNKSSKVKSQDIYPIVIFAVLMAAVSVYYYFRVIQAMYFKDGEGGVIQVSPFFKGTLIVLAALIILLGIYPEILLYWIYF